MEPNGTSTFDVGWVIVNEHSLFRADLVTRKEMLENRPPGFHHPHFARNYNSLKDAPKVIPLPHMTEY